MAIYLFYLFFLMSWALSDKMLTLMNFFIKINNNIFLLFIVELMIKFKLQLLKTYQWLL